MNESELQKKIIELENANDEKTNILSISAHELRTSLTSLKWIMRMLLDGDVGTISQEQKHLLSKGYENTERMISVVSEMLMLGHTEDCLNKKEERKSVDLIQLIEDVVFDFTGESYKKRIELIFLKPAIEIKNVYVNREKTRVVLQNLIENAIKYSTESDRVFISISENENYTRVTVKDTGIGIPTEEQPKIFEKFFRAENARKHEVMGTGLGLYTSKIIIEKEGGKLSFISKEKKDGITDNGTTFYLDLPIH